MQRTDKIYLTGTGSCLPGLPITNCQVETILGHLPDAPPKVQSFVKSMGPRMLERSGIETRHFAVDPETGNLTHSFASLAEAAARNAIDAAELIPEEIDFLVISCPSYDQSTPPTSAMLQERLGIETCAEMEIHSNCSGVGKAVQVAFDALSSGRYRTALVCYAQLSSVYLRDCYFNQAAMNKVNAALRWILADGAGAVVLQSLPHGGDKPVVLGTFVESVGGGRPAGMTAGGAVLDLMEHDRQIPQLYDDGMHHLWQDFNAVNDNAAPLLLEGLVRSAFSTRLTTSEVDHYIVSIPTKKLYDDYIETFESRLGVSRDRIQFRCGGIGYVGGAATLVHLDQMMRGGEIQPGHTVMVHAVESSKWMTAGFALRWEPNGTTSPGNS